MLIFACNRPDIKQGVQLTLYPDLAKKNHGYCHIQNEIQCTPCLRGRHNNHCLTLCSLVEVSLLITDFVYLVTGLKSLFSASLKQEICPVQILAPQKLCRSFIFNLYCYLRNHTRLEEIIQGLNCLLADD